MGERGLVLWRHRLLVDTASRQPVLVEAADVDGPAAILPLGGGERDERISLLELDSAHDGLARLRDPDGLRFIDPMFELGGFPQPLRAHVVRALALERWSSQTLYCSICAAPLGWEVAGAVKLCENPSEPHRHFPRLDPATIMLVHDGDRMLLGRQPTWPEGMYSTLAGFVDLGESAEEAVAREVFEEAGVRVRDVSYFGSEPWPFPRSLMLGFFAVAATTEIVRGEELADVRWFGVDEGLELQRTLAARMPGADTIARRLIATWLRGRGAQRT